MWFRLTFGIQLVLAVLAYLSDDPVLRWLMLSTALGVAGAAIYRGFRYSRLVLDTPTSKAASAALGYVELVGRSEASAGTPLLSRLTGLPCLWYRYRVDQQRHNLWVKVDSGESHATFALRDSSGICVIDPAHAEVVSTRTERWTKDGYRFTESLLLPHDKLYALGELRTTAGAHSALTRQEGTRVLRKPADGRPYLLSNLPPDVLARRYRLWKHVNFGCMTVLAAALFHGLYSAGAL